MKLTKSEYMLGRSCPVKVQHLRDGMPRRQDNDPFTAQLAEVGAIIHWMAPKMYANTRMGISMDMIQPGHHGVYSEVSVESTLCHARMDILQYHPGTVTLSEFKSKVVPTHSATGEIKPVMRQDGKIYADWKDLVDDITFQSVTLFGHLGARGEIIEAGMDFRAELVMINPDFESSLNDLRHQFRVINQRVVSFSGDLDALLSSNLLIPVDVTQAVMASVKRVQAEIESLHKQLMQGAMPVLSSTCASCEFRVPLKNGQPNGFLHCWGEKAYHDPFILDLTEVGRLQDKHIGDVVRHVVATVDARMTSIPAQHLKPKYNNRQARQIEAATKGSVIIGEALAQALSSHPYPKAFIDVEAVSSGLAYWPSCRPFEVTTFQLSVHTADAQQAPLRHTEWLHESAHHPCMDFLRALMASVGGANTIYIYSSYERTAVNAAAKAAERMGLLDSITRDWVTRFLDNNADHVVDLLGLIRDHYMHPAMRGSASIKYVLPTIWSAAPHIRRAFPEYVSYDADNTLQSPYAALPSLGGIAGLGDVRDGTAAVTAYTTMMFDGSIAAADRDAIHSALLEYCKLDTAAMVMLHDGVMRMHTHMADE
ncbi:MAG: DUF2779 domain-containing protein [Candidatus Kapabacteria bacterium]|nr:DUF2779 domain-containing protein [Candidatus Kapabacteria bacterium]